MEDMNWIALIVGALIPMVMGFIWYSPMLFGKAWMSSIGKTEEDLKEGNMAVIMGISLLLAGCLAFFVMGMLGIHDYIYDLQDKGAYPHDFGHGAYHGGMMGLMFAIPVLVTNSLFEQKSWSNIGINAAYWVITIALMGGVMSLLV